jgi:hypothetical protein
MAKKFAIAEEIARLDQENANELAGQTGAVEREPVEIA